MFSWNNDGLKNSLSRGEWTGAIGDLGTMIPLGFALIVYNGFAPGQLFLWWGVVYVISGWMFKIPVSVQPLKVMSVVAISQGLSIEFLASTSFFYGLFFILISTTGIIDWLQKLFSTAMVKGIQLGIGLILAKKALDLIFDHGFILNQAQAHPMVNVILFFSLLVLIIFLQIRRKFPLTIILILISIPTLVFMGYRGPQQPLESLVMWTPPKWGLFLDAALLLMIPQLPLTLGNAVYAASDACHSLWPARAQRVTPKRLAFTIGVSNTAIGLLGGFPICHGAGGMGAHARFGATTGAATMIMGILLILLALIPNAAAWIFLIPVPLLAVMLLLDSWMMMKLTAQLKDISSISVALVIGIISFITHNIALALASGFLLERILNLIQTRQVLPTKETPHD